MSGTPDDFEREILMHRGIFEGEPVIKNYQDALHCPPKFQERRIPLIPGSIYFGTLDCGQSIQPAAVLLQIAPVPFQVHALQEVISFGGESMEDFAPRVMDAFMARLPGNWDEIRYFGDETVNTRSGSDGRSARVVAKKLGMDIRPVSNNWPKRRAAVEWLLARFIDERTPGFLLDAQGCPMLRKALQGGYQWHVAGGGSARDPNEVVLKPRKNIYSHIADAFQYGAVKIRQLVEGGGARNRED